MPKTNASAPRPYRWRTQFNNSEFPDTKEISFLPSETRPDEVMTMREIEKRYAGGRSIHDVLPRPIWDTSEPEPDFDDYLPNVKFMDHADRLQLLEDSAAELETIKERANELAKQRKLKRDAEKAEQDKQQAATIAALMAKKTTSEDISDD